MRRSNSDHLVDATQPKRRVAVKTFDQWEGSRDIASHAVRDNINLNGSYRNSNRIRAAFELVHESRQLFQHHGCVISEAQRVLLRALDAGERPRGIHRL